MKLNLNFLQFFRLVWNLWNEWQNPKYNDPVEQLDAKHLETPVTYTLKDIQIYLKGLGYDPGPTDGKNGPKTKDAIKKFQTDHNLLADGLIGPQTLSALFPTKFPSEQIFSSKFDKASASRLAKAHPLLQKLMNAARERISFQILDSQRGKDAQEKAFREGHSHAHFGQSAHNYDPAVALDITPLPLNWKDIESFKKLSEVILPLAKELDIPIQWGGNWKTLKDFPHYELDPWRNFAKNLIKS